jgi:hypothetical protein
MKTVLDRGMRKGTPREDYRHAITVYGRTEPCKQRLGFQSTNVPYLVLLGQRGTVRWLYRRQCDAEAYGRLSPQVAALLE